MISDDYDRTRQEFDDHDPDEDVDDEAEDDEAEDDDYALPPVDPVSKHLRVMRTKCLTCIFRPGNPMQLNDGRVAGMLAEVRAKDGFIQCHQTLGTGEPGAICRGSSDAHVGQLERIAGRLGVLDLVDPPAKDAT